MKFLNIVALLLALGLGIGVLQLKLDIKEKRAVVEALAGQIRSDREHIRVLKAEWALLSSPALLQERSYRFLALMPLAPNQILSSPDAIPMRRRGVDAGEDPGILLPTADRQQSRETGKNRTNEQPGFDGSKVGSKKASKKGHKQQGNGA